MIQNDWYSNDWFSKDFMKMRDKWIAVNGYQQLCEDAGRAGVEVTEFPDVVEVKYRCVKCQAPMVDRSGKFGAFLACPKGTMEDKHPTQKMPKDYGTTVVMSRQPKYHPEYKITPLHVRLLQDDTGE